MGNSEQEIGYTAFISYASPDAEKAEEICACLEAKGMRCWLAPRDVRAGRDYGGEIIRGIEQSRCMVLILSEAANESPHVRNEVERAVSKRKPVFPVRVEEVMPSPGLELFVSATHWIDAWMGRLVDHANRLAQDLADDSVVERAAGASQRANRRRLAPRWVVTGAGFVALVAAIVLGNHLSSRFDRGAAEATGEMIDRSDYGPEGSEMEPYMVPPFPPVTPPATDRGVVDAMDIARDDLTPVMEASRVGMTLNIEMSAAAGAAIGAGADLQYAFDDDPFSTMRRGSTAIRSDQTRWMDAQTLRLQVQFRDGNTAGPFEYDLEEDTGRLEVLKAWVKEQPQWLAVAQWGVTTSRGGFWSLVRAVHIGESAEKLDLVMRVNDDGKERRRAGPWRHMPVRQGAEELFMQIEFLDGTQSEVRRMAVPSGAGHDPGRRAGVRLELVDGPQEDAPIVFGTFHDGLRLGASRPVEAAQAFYSVDGGALARTGIQGPTPGRAPSILSITTRPIARDSITLEFRDEDGGRIGPFTYSVGDVESHLAAGLKAVNFDEPPLRWVACVRVAFEYPFELAPEPEPHDPDDVSAIMARWQRSQNALMQWRADNTARSLAWGVNLFRDDAPWPAVVLFGTNRSTEARAWAAVEEVRFGTESGVLDGVVAIDLTPADVLEAAVGRTNYEGWRAFLPVETEEVFVKLVYRDGTKSEEMRLVPEEIEPPAGISLEN